ncbi:hypothetical protein [Aquimarina sp. MMG016]|uniref:hypothetical protein n=1 Tax=Aquimarina sp. MMG016 TaxID=2822690 RepID=UPI001B39D9A2|nr:hypothetical protein [Aquimarina sp. MMG016]MBQ4821510.1 hypothetical protein [Aquimarina sp. MMG016]
MTNQKFISFFFFLFLTFNFYPQSDCPTDGNLVLVGEKMTINQDLINQSLKKLVVNFTEFFKDFMVEKYQKEGKEIDSIEVQTLLKEKLIPAIKLDLDPGSYSGIQMKHEYTFKDSIIEYKFYDSRNLDSDEITRINKNDGSKENFLFKDSTYVSLKRVQFSMTLPKDEEIINIEEYPEDRKNIKGFECFRVVVKKKKNILKNGVFAFFFKDSKVIDKHSKKFEKIIMENYYVTKDINCQYHPIVKDSTILSKYYPIEITIEDNSLKGTKTIYKTQKHSIKPTKQRVIKN